MINNLRYADDAVLIADSAKDLQTLINQLVEVYDRFVMKLNCKKTNIVIVSKNGDTRYLFSKNNEILEIADKLMYLGCNQNKEHPQEIRCSIEKA